MEAEVFKNGFQKIIEDCKKFKITLQGAKEGEIKKSLDLMISFYAYITFFTMIFYNFWSYFLGYNVYLYFYILIIIWGSFFVGFMTQKIQWIILTRDKNPPLLDSEHNAHIIKNSYECFIRCSAGLCEIILYSISSVMGLEALIAGYIVLKTVSVWTYNKVNDNKTSNLADPEEGKRKEGLFTAVLRIAVVLSLLFSLFASYFLFKYLQSFQAVFDLSHHFLFK